MSGPAIEKALGIGVSLYLELSTVGALIFIPSSTSHFSAVPFVDTDFCALPGRRCHDNATCVNLSTRHACVCDTGFRGDGKRCHGNSAREVSVITDT